MIIEKNNIINNDKNQYGILINSTNNLIRNNNIYTNTINPYTSIIINNNENKVESNKININSTTNNAGILINTSNNTLERNVINVTTNSKIINTTSISIGLNNSDKNYMQDNRIYINRNTIIKFK